MGPRKQKTCTECGTPYEGSKECPHCGGDSESEPTIDDGKIEVGAALDEIRELFIEKSGFYLECSICGSPYDPETYSEGAKCSCNGILKRKEPLRGESTTFEDFP
jgi:hypothetical protein